MAVSPLFAHWEGSGHLPKLHWNVGPDCDDWLRPGVSHCSPIQLSFFHDPPTFQCSLLRALVLFEISGSIYEAVPASGHELWQGS